MRPGGRFLLDTHVLIWLVNGSTRLGTDARERIDGAAELWISVASLWEIAIKTSLGKLPAVPGLATTLTAGGAHRLAIEAGHLEALASLPWVAGHRDPFDRMLIAQAQTEGLALVSSDRRLSAYDVEISAAGT